LLGASLSASFAPFPGIFPLGQTETTSGAANDSVAEARASMMIQVVGFFISTMLPITLHRVEFDFALVAV
jgi:hypothetical protein